MYFAPQNPNYPSIIFEFESVYPKFAGNSSCKKQQMEILAGELHLTDRIRFMVVCEKITSMTLEAKEQLWKAHFKYFPGMQVVMMLVGANRETEYYGRRDLINWMLKEQRKPVFEKHTF
jgi:hypothetical protein